MAESRLGIRKSSVEKLNELGFDPIEAMVKKYNLMVIELECQKQIKDGTLVRLTASGQEKAYSPHFHMELAEKASNLAEKLMRYGYARVDEGKDSGKNTTPPSLHINLSDKEGTFSLNVNQSPSDSE